MLARNLTALARSNPEIAERLRAVKPADLDGMRYRGRALCSARDPIAEGQRIADGIDLRETAVAVVLGFGAGYHVAATVKRIGRMGSVLVYEPDLALLRAVLERVDHSRWLGWPMLCIVTDATTLPDILAPAAGMVAMGCRFVATPQDEARIGDAAGAFMAEFTRAFATVRTHLVTGLGHAGITIDNQLKNLGRYVTCRGVADLKDAHRGRPAITVAAGPSLARNVRLLAGARGRYVVIAVQTVLKPLLELGIVPHFVTALDWSPLGARFYDGLTEADVRGVHLVCDVNVNPAIPAAWPGVLRMAGEPTMDELVEPVVGPGYAATMGDIPHRANVAQMAYELGRYMGCDPIIMVGQDLGYTDCQYYGLASGTTRDQWACELNEFCTLEMREWERIARNKAGNVKVPAQGGGTVHTDALMLVYLSGFRSMWQRDIAAGLTVIDATEGGVDKAPATPMSLREALVTYRPAEPLGLNEPPPFVAEPMAGALARHRRLDIVAAAGQDKGVR